MTLPPIRISAVGVTMALTVWLTACGRQEAAPAPSSAAALPKACIEAENIQSACAQRFANALERAGEAAEAKAFSDKYAIELARTRARWHGVPDKNGLAASCEMLRSAHAREAQCGD